MSSVTQIFKRNNGAEIKVVAQYCFGLGLARSVDVCVFHRDGPNHEWKRASNMPHPDWRKMSVDEYIKKGRPEMLQMTSYGEILKVTRALALL